MPDGISRQKSRAGPGTITTISTQSAAPNGRCSTLPIVPSMRQPSAACGPAIRHTTTRTALELNILLGVLAAAACLGQLEHALELKLEPMAAICIGIGGRSLWRRLGARARRSYILGSAAIQIVYYLALAQAYRFGDLRHVYSIARRRSAADGDADHALGLMRASAAAHLTGGCDPADMGIVLLAARGEGTGAL